jgi:hypothetical protein
MSEIPQRELVRACNVALLAASMAGFAAALWAHVEALRGLDPHALFPGIWSLQLLLNILLVPLVFSFFRRGLARQIEEFPRWTRRILIALAVYYSLHFYLFMKLAANEIRAAWTWRMFSAGWMALFAAPSAYYWTLIQRRRPE